MQPNRNPHDQDPASSQIQILPVRGNVYLLVGAGSNLTLLMGPDNVLLVDTGDSQVSESVLQAIGQFTDKSIRYIVNTSAHQGHTGGNERIAQAGSTITGGTVFADANEIAAVIAHENVLHAMIDAPDDALPSVTFNTADKKLSPSFHNEGVHIIHMPGAVTDGDSIVHFRGSDVISAGDIFLTTSYPFIDIEKGGSYQRIIDALNGILDLAIPDYWMEGGTMIIPGHGRISDSADVGYYRDVLTIIRDRVQDMIKKGMTLNQVIAARPTLDYDPRYGSDTGSWTTDMFVEAVYRSLNK